MGIEFSKYNVKYIESSEKRSWIIFGITMIALGLLFLRLTFTFNLNDPVEEKYFVRELLISVFFIILGLYLVFWKLFYKPKIYDLYTNKIMISLKKSKEIIHDIPLSQIKEIIKTTNYKKERPKSEKILYRYIYEVKAPKTSFRLFLSPNNSNSEKLDDFIQNEMGIEMKTKEWTIYPKVRYT